MDTVHLCTKKILLWKLVASEKLLYRCIFSKCETEILTEKREGGESGWDLSLWVVGGSVLSTYYWLLAAVPQSSVVSFMVYGI